MVVRDMPTCLATWVAGKYVIPAMLIPALTICRGSKLFPHVAAKHTIYGPVKMEVLKILYSLVQFASHPRTSYPPRLHVAHRLFSKASTENKTRSRVSVLIHELG